MIEMKVAGIALDAVNRTPIVLLKDTTERRALPIYIGQDQARAILNALDNQVVPRPLTHDLMTNLLDTWEMNLERVIIHSLQDSTFFAILSLSIGEIKKELDARPSDAIALALRTNSPIWVMEEVIADASIPVDYEADEAERREFREFLAKLRPEDFGDEKHPHRQTQSFEDGAGESTKESG
ncbi:MAG: bifunctional nuclease family protein [Cyanophyceae cyanobacterium]